MRIPVAFADGMEVFAVTGVLAEEEGGKLATLLVSSPPCPSGWRYGPSEVVEVERGATGEFP